MSAEHIAYLRHVAACEAAEHGRWCRECEALVKDADAASWRKRG